MPKMSRAGVVAICVVALVASALPAQAQTWTFSGSGWGHGIGMSQYGARGYAEAGMGYADILRHFYRGTAVQSRPEIVPSVRVGILPSQNPVHLRGNGPIEFVNQGQIIATGQANEPWQVANSGDRFVLRRNGAVVAQNVGSTSSPLFVRFASRESRVFIAETNHWYAYGTLEFNIVPGGGMRSIIEILDMDQYLYGLGEVPSSWHTEALRAQAVAARTYATEKIRRLGQHRSGCNCGMHASTVDQAYIGFTKEANDPQGRWRAAVNATSGVLVTSGGNPIQAFYSSSSGGHTENNENVWGGGAIGYLRGVHDAGDIRTSPFIGWQARFSQSDINERLNRREATAVGSLRQVDIVDPTGVSRRVTPVQGSSGGARLVGSSGTKRVSGDQIRTALGLRSTLFQPGALAYSGKFTGGVFVAAGDLHNNNQNLVVTGAGRGGGPHVRVVREDGTAVRDWMAYGTGFRGGVTVAMGNLVGDARREIVTGPFSNGGPHVRVWSHDGSLLHQFMAFSPGFGGGISVAVANGDVIVGAGPGMEPWVRVFSPDGRLKREWLAYGRGFRGGVRVGAGNIASGRSGEEIVTCPGPGGGPHIRVWSGAGQLLGQWGAYGQGWTGGVFCSAADVTGSGEAEVLTGADAGGGPHVRAFRGNAQVVRSHFATTGSFRGGVRVAGFSGAMVTGLGPGWWPLYRTWR